MASLLPFPKPKVRFTLVDFFRGFALLGLLLVHVSDRFGLEAGPGLNDRLSRIIHLMFAGKAFAILALCFGLSYHFLSQKAVRSGESLLASGFARYGTLLVLGILNSFIFGGDVLQVIAILGLVLVLVARIEDNRIILWMAAACCLELPILLTLPVALIAPEFAEKYLQVHSEVMAAPQARIQHAYQHGNVFELAWTNLTDGNAAKWWFMVSSGRLYRSFGLFLLGIYLGRVDFCAKPVAFMARHRAFFVFTALLAPATMVVKYLLRDAAVDINHLPASVGIVKALSTGYFNMIATVFMVAALAWLHTKISPKFLYLLEDAGKMTLTHYIVQGLVFVPLLYGFGAAKYQTLSTVALVALALFVFASQIVLGHLWLGLFRLGPIEWAWRTVAGKMTTVLSGPRRQTRDPDPTPVAEDDVAAQRTPSSLRQF